MVNLDLEAFVSGLIHAVNNPLTYVQTNLTSLRRDVGDFARLLEAMEALLPHVDASHAAEVDRVRRLRADLAMDHPGEVLEQIISDAQDGLRQVQVYLRATRALPKQLGGEAEMIDAEPWLAEIVAGQRGGLPPGLELSLAGSPGGPFMGVRLHWTRIVETLFQNAREALLARRDPRAPGQIRVTASPGRVIVEDDGSGVPAAIRDRIFLPYFTTRPGAVGLGLAVAVQVARAGGGDVVLLEEPGSMGGARFAVRLPSG
jgi:two-component system NtrC family sensor kinase